VSYYYEIGLQILFLILLATSLNLLLGYAGQMSMAQAAFYGIGAYTAGRLAVPVAKEISIAISSGVYGGAGWPIIPAIVVGVIASFVVAAVISLPAVSRVTGELLILLTLAFQIVAQQLMTTLEHVTGGTYGLSGIPPLKIFGHSFVGPDSVFWPVLVLTVIVVVLMYGLGESPFGRLLKGIREHEHAVRAVGKGTVRPKVLVFGVAAAVAGFAGALNASYYAYLAPSTFELSLSILVISVIVLGGAANMTGSVIAAIAIGALPYILRKAVGDNAILWQGVIYGAALVVVMRVRPQGLLPEGTGLRSLVRLFRGPVPEPVAAGHQVSAGLMLPGGNGSIAAGDPAGAGGSGEGRREGATAPTAASGLSSPGELAAGGVAGTTATVSAAAERALVNHADRESMVVVKGLSKHFRGIHAVQGVDFELKRGLITALVGPNGAGKTTIFNLITNTIKPDAGTVELLGKDVTGRAPQQIAREGMARSFQDTRLFLQLSALDNVTIAVPNQLGESLLGLGVRPLRSRKVEKQARERAIEFLDFVGFAPSPNAIAGSLSYGDQKLIAIARLLAVECEVLLLDEPTSGVDPKGLERVIETVAGLRDAGKTICLVEHSLHVVGKLADHAIFLDQGKVVEEGTIEELMSREHLTEIYFGG
jgi:branched-chain amino acid transport system ATP-binding protein/branched-chain amino acid transport system permease protein